MRGKETPLLTVRLAQERDVVAARQRAKQISGLLGFDPQDQVKIATAVSEIARNAFTYAAGGRVEFAVAPGASASLVVRVADNGPGIPNLAQILKGTYESRTGMGLGILGARRLMDEFTIQSVEPQGTVVTLSKQCPPGAPAPNPARIARLAAELAARGTGELFSELKDQNQELLRVLQDVRDREREHARLNAELEETNRGVLALYAELEDQAGSLKAASEMKSRFLSHMSHEFRTPLNSILALTHLLDQRVDGDLTPEQVRQVGFIRKAAQDLYDLVNDLLDLAKVEAGKTAVTCSEVDVARLFGALRGLMRPLHTNVAVQLAFEEPDAPLILFTDESKVSQILRNLLSNALKFTERGEVRIRAAAGPDGVRFDVTDTGIGIRLEDQGRLFQEFAQIENPIQKRVKGTGLGLSLSRKLAELLGGSLTVESKPGVGSRFTVTLPASSIMHPHPESIRAGGSTGQQHSETVLIIDDEDVGRYLTSQLFRGTRYAVIEAENGAIGAERARFERPRLILLDVNMPVMDGFETLDELKRHDETRDIPVIIVTNRMLTDEVARRLAGRHAGFLSKDELESEVAYALVRSILKDDQIGSKLLAERNC